eukprot:205641_1
MWECVFCGLFNYNKRVYCQACFEQIRPSTKRLEHFKDVICCNELTVYEYSQLLYNTLKKYSYSTEHKILMNLCIDISFFITASNGSILKYESEKYLYALNNYCPEYIAQIVISFIIHTSNYLKWMQFDKDNIHYQKQLNYSCNDSIVDFRNARQDYINIRTQLLDSTLKYFINIYIFEKGDEMVIGLITKKGYTPNTFPPYCKHALTYYGGTSYYVKRDGGSKTSPCSGYAGRCNHGNIFAYGRGMKHPLDAYGSGDWLQFVVDFPKKTMVIYKNGVKECEIEPKYFPSEQCYFWFCVDNVVDKLYIEQANRAGSF